MFGILWENRQNPRIWPNLRNEVHERDALRSGPRGIRADSSPGASPAVDLAAFDQRAKTIFKKRRRRVLPGFALGVDTSKAGGGGKAAAVLKSIEFIGSERN
jgi:hypothetical protein